MPLRLPLGELTPEATDDLLAGGFRRSGDFFYRTQCPQCHECHPTRVDVEQFQWTRSLRRVLQRGRRDLTFRWGPVQVDDRRVDLYNMHRKCRHLELDDRRIDVDDYRAFLVDSRCQTRELAIRLDGQLIAVSIVDIGKSSVSAVYTYFDPSAGRFCPGTLAILEQISWARTTGRQWVYLGMYVELNRHLNYKSRFVPQERLEKGEWRPYAVR